MVSEYVPHSYLESYDRTEPSRKNTIKTLLLISDDKIDR